MLIYVMMVWGAAPAMATLLDLYYAVRTYVNAIANLPGAIVPPLKGKMARIIIQSVGGPVLESFFGQKAAAAPIQIQDCQAKGLFDWSARCTEHTLPTDAKYTYTAMLLPWLVRFEANMAARLIGF